MCTPESEAVVGPPSSLLRHSSPSHRAGITFAPCARAAIHRPYKTCKAECDKTVCGRGGSVLGALRFVGMVMVLSFIPKQPFSASLAVAQTLSSHPFVLKHTVADTGAPAAWVLPSPNAIPARTRVLCHGAA